MNYEARLSLSRHPKKELARMLSELTKKTATAQGRKDDVQRLCGAHDKATILDLIEAATPRVKK